MSELAINRTDVGDLISWAQAAREVHTVATMIAKTEFVPKALQGRPDAISAAILTSREIGISPMVGLAAIDVIEGKPALNALALRGLVQSHGHEIETVEQSDTRVTVRGRRKGSEHWETSTWTMARAEKAGLAGRPAYKRMAQQMFTARATSEVCRLVGADAILGLAYSQEELRDGEEGDEVTAPPTRAKRVLQRAPAPPPPPLEPYRPAAISAPTPEPLPEPEPTPRPEPGEMEAEDAG